MMREPVISLGAGVQSSVLLLMAARGELPGHRPRLAVFSDTQNEPHAVYEHLDYLEHEVAGRIEIVRVSAMDLGHEARTASYNPIPLYTSKGGVGRRQCTYQAKLVPLRRELRRRGYGPKRPVEQWLGITTNEIQRVKPSSVKWASNAYPLLDLGMSREDCKRWAAEHGFRAAPRSACTFCPFHTDAEWREMKRNDPVSWAEAVDFDHAMRKRDEFVHSSRVPLDLVDLASREDRGQLTLDQMDECEGGCFL